MPKSKRITGNARLALGNGNLWRSAYTISSFNPMPTTLHDLRAAVVAAATEAERASALNQLAGELAQQSQYAESLAVAEEAQAAAKQAGDAPAEAEALRLQGIAHWRKEAYPEALRLLKQSLVMVEGLGDRPGVARTTLNIGLVYK
ncbi:MAG: hypothetical protein DYG96_16000 [Chlorobi bacterium CHB2]|nr:hypothetical protein [Chlorobi bacterium CHB2]